MKKILKRLFDSTHKKPNREMLLKFLWRARLDVSTNGYGVIMIEDISVPSVKLNVEGVPYYRNSMQMYRIVEMLKYLKVEIVNKDEVRKFIHHYIDEHGLYCDSLYDKRLTPTSYLVETYDAILACNILGISYDSPELAKHVRAYADKDAYLLHRQDDCTYMKYYRYIAVFADALGILDEIREGLREKVLAYRQPDGSFVSEIAIGESMAWVVYETQYAIGALRVLGGADEIVEIAEEWLADEDNIKRVHDNIGAEVPHDLTLEEWVQEAYMEWDADHFDISVTSPWEKEQARSSLYQCQTINRLYRKGGQEVIDEMFGI